VDSLLEQMFIQVIRIVFLIMLLIRIWSAYYRVLYLTLCMNEQFCTSSKYRYRYFLTEIFQRYPKFTKLFRAGVPVLYGHFVKSYPIQTNNTGFLSIRSYLSQEEFSRKLCNFTNVQAGTASTILNTMDMLNLGKKTPHVQAIESLCSLFRSIIFLSIIWRLFNVPHQLIVSPFVTLTANFGNYFSSLKNFDKV
jgi:hypothetical protein